MNTTSAQDHQSPVTRAQVKVPVEVSELGTVEIATWLSAPDAAGNDVLQILVHGGNYTHLYWDFPYQPEVYSYVRWAEERGITTLAIDQLGVGESTRPPGEKVTNQKLAEALHGLVQTARSSGIAGHLFDRIVLVGHSAGSLASGMESFTYDDVDAVVLTGILGPNTSGIINHRPRNVDRYRPAAEDAVLRGRPEMADREYQTLRPEFRVAAFYHVPPADPALIVLDETLKDTQANGQSATYGDAAEACGKLRCPTLVINGQYDALHFDPETEDDITPAVERAKAIAPPNYTFAPIVPEMGHNLNQHPGARDVYRTIEGWVDATFSSRAR
jgi:pimeloyl-ACP methyl ester carboxylesterase